MNTRYNIEHAAEACCRRGLIFTEESTSGLLTRFGGADAKAFPLPGDEPQWPRDRVCDLRHTKLEIALDVEERRISGVASHTLSPINDGLTSLELDAVELDVTGVRLEGDRELAFTTSGGKLNIDLGRAWNAGEELTLLISYSSQPRRGLYFNVPDDAYPGRPRQVWTQGQDEDSRFWFPCFDHPNQRFTSEIIAKVPASWTAISNGRLVSSEAEGDHRTFHWLQDKLHSTYLMSLVAGEYTQVRDDVDGVTISYYSPPGREGDTRRAFGNTPKMVQFFAEKIGVPYPWDKYSQVTVADFIFGGMENTSATTMTDALLHNERAHLDYSADSIVAHELAHQWWGDLVTCRDWSHGWLNEGFATYFDLLFKEHDLGRDEFRYAVYQDATTYLQEDSQHYRRPIVSNVYRQPVDIFDRHLYEKGALVLHMLRAYLGDDMFWKALNHYCTKHRGGNVTTDDLQKAVEESTGRSMDRFFRQWVYKGGHPAFKLTYQWDEETKTARLGVSQTQAADETTSIFAVPIVLAYETSQGRREVKLDISEANQTFYIPTEEKPLMVSFDPGYWCLKTLEFELSREMLTYQLAHDEDIIGRITAAQGLAKQEDPRSVEALAEAVKTDEFWGVQSEAAKALGVIKSQAALEALVGCADVAHPKARRAVVAALGNFKEKAAFDALLPFMEQDDSYFVEAEAVRAVCKTREARAFDAVTASLGKTSFNDIFTAQGLTGLGDLQDERAIQVAKEWAGYGKPARAREAALGCLAKLCEQKKEIAEWVADYLDDPWLRVRAGAARALQEIREPVAIPALGRRIPRELDGRVVRQCREAIASISAGRDRGEDVKKLRTDLESLGEENRKLKDRLEKLEDRLDK